LRVKNTNLTISTDWSTSANSNYEYVEHVAALSVHVVIISASGLSGTIALQASNCDDDGGTHWVDVATTTLTTESGTKKYMLKLDVVPYQQIRISWTRSAGTGTLAHAQLFTKGF